MHKVFSKMRGFKSTTSFYGAGDGYITGEGDVNDYDISCGVIYSMDLLSSDGNGKGKEPNFIYEYCDGSFDGDGIKYGNDLWLELKNA